MYDQSTKTLFIWGAPAQTSLIWPDDNRLSRIVPRSRRGLIDKAPSNCAKDSLRHLGTHLLDNIALQVNGIRQPSLTECLYLRIINATF
jgi:hypothetical protein